MELCCWGWNTHGQVLNINTTNINNFIDEEDKFNMGIIDGELYISNEVRMVSVGGAHTCFVLSRYGEGGNKLYCRGYNLEGQINTPYDSRFDVESITAGYKHSCSIAKSGQLYCWGRNKHGESDIDIGKIDFNINNNGLKIVNNDNDNNDNNNNDKYTTIAPLKFSPNLSEEVDISQNDKGKYFLIGRYHTCLMSEKNKVRCFGSNRFGQIRKDDG